MKKVFPYFIMAVAITLGTLYQPKSAPAEPVDTGGDGYKVARAEADENASAINLASNGGAAASRPTDIYTVEKAGWGTGQRNTQLHAIIAGGIDAGTDPADKTFSWKLYAYKDAYSPAEYWAYGTGTLGTQDVVKFPSNVAVTALRNWADTLVVTASYAPRPVYVTTGAHNSVAHLSWDHCGYRYFYFEFASADGATGTEAGAISVWVGSF